MLEGPEPRRLHDVGRVGVVQPVSPATAQISPPN